MNLQHNVFTRDWFRILCFIFFVALPWQTQYVFFAPSIAGAPWEYGVVRFYAIEVLLGVTLIVALCSGTVRVFFARMSMRARVGMVAALVFFALWTFIPGGLTMRSAMIFLHSASAVGVAALVWVCVVRYGKRFALASFMFGAVIAVIFGIYQYGAQTSPASSWLGLAAHDPLTRGDAVVQIARGFSDGESMRRILRVYGPLPHPNAFGGYLVMGLVAAALLYIGTRSHRERWLVTGAAACVLIALVWTYSRSAWLGAFALALVAAIYFFKKNIPIARAHIFALVAVGAIVVGFSWPAIATRFALISAAPLERAAPLEQRSRDERMMSLAQGITLFKNHALFGVGIGRYTDALQRVYTGQSGYAYQPAHNSYLLALVEMGIIGVGILFTIIFFIRRYWIFSWFMLPVAIMAFFDHYWWSSLIGVFLLVCIGFFNEKSYPQQSA